jgi:acetyl-CoA C-acetyltransferase/acetyl-CoA acyltransferase
MSVYIVGASLGKVGRHFDKGYKEIASDVIRDLVKKTGTNDIDYMVVSNVFSDCVLNQLDISTMLMQNLGLSPRASIRVETGESSGMTALEYAYNLIKSSKAHKVLVLGIEKLTEYPTIKINTVYNKILDYEIEGVRNISPPNYAALIMKAYMNKYELTREDLSIWPVKMHEFATDNPYAQLRFKTTVEKVIDSMVISEPIRLMDSFPIGDGAAAILLASEKSTSGINVEPIELVDIVSATSPPFYLRNDILSLPATRAAFKELVKKHNIDLEESVIEIHDSYTIYAYLTLEELGIYEKGKSVKMISEGNLDRINLSGGLKARGHPVGATGVYQVAEIYYLLTDGLGGKKVDALWGIAHSMSGPDYNARIALVKRW